MKEKIKIIGIGNQAYKIVKKNISQNRAQWDCLLIKKNKEGLSEIFEGEERSLVSDIEGEERKLTISKIDKALTKTNKIILISNAGDEFFNETLVWLNPVILKNKISVWGILILPFKWEGMKRLLNAKKNIEMHSSIINKVVILEPEKMVNQKNVVTAGDAFEKVRSTSGSILTSLHKLLESDNEYLDECSIKDGYDNNIHSALVRYEKIDSAAGVARDLLFNENISLSIMNKLKLIYLHISSRQEINESAENKITGALKHFFRDECEIRTIKTINKLQKKLYILTLFGFTK